MSAEATSIARNEPDTAILLGLQALSAAHADADRPPPSAGLISGLAEVSHESTLLTAHTGQVHAVAYSHDGRFAVTGSWDRTVRFWDPRTYQEAGAPIQSPSSVNALAISPDSRLIATGGQDGIVRLWDAATRRAGRYASEGGRELLVQRRVQPRRPADRRWFRGGYRARLGRRHRSAAARPAVR